MTPWKLLRSGRLGLAALGVGGCVIVLRLTGLLQILEWAALDQFIRLRALEPVDNRILLVTLDEIDLRRVGQWPISDQVMADLLKQIQRQQPRVIGLDIYRDLAVEPGHQALTQLFTTLPNLIGIHRLPDNTSQEILPPPVLANRGQIGFNNLVYDQDGKVRRGILYWTVNDQPYKSFALAIALKYLQVEGITEQSATSNLPHLKLGKAIFPQFQANDGAYVRADDGGYQFLANLRGPTRRFQQISVTQVLEGRIPPNLMRDRIVMIGSTAVSLKDFFPTSYNTALFGHTEGMSGVELQANLVSQIISSALDNRPLLNVWPEPVEWIWILLWSGLGVWIIWYQRSLLTASPLLLLAGGGLITMSYLAFLGGWWLPIVPPLLALSTSALVITLYLAYLQEELKRSKEFLNTVINAIPDPVFVKDQNHRWIVVNQAFCRLLGYPMETLLEQTDHDVFSLTEADKLQLQDQAVLINGQELESEETLTDQAGHTYQIATKRTLHRDAAGNLFLIGVMRDITERKRMEEDLKRTATELAHTNAELQRSAHQLQHLANHDSLTGLPNRQLFGQRLEQAILWARSNRQILAILFVDLDGFKQINDTEGHRVGDGLLQMISCHLTGCLRSSDTIARLGGDEFTVILPAIPGKQEATRVAEKLLSTLAQPFVIEGKTVAITASIGISLYPQDGQTADELLNQADIAMYQAKQAGKNGYAFVG